MLGAIRAALPEAGFDAPEGQLLVASPREWWQGLFRIQDDTHFNFTYKLSQIGWFNIMIETRSDESGGTYSGAFLYKNTEMWKTDLDRWRTVSVPLKYFRVPDGAKIQRGPLQAGHAVFRFYFSTETDSALVIDRIWVSRGAPESAEILGPRQ
jgi:hypothetical protein